MKRLSGIIAVAFCGALSLFALTGCEALGIEVTSSGIRANSNTLIICTLIIIVLVVVVQRLLDR